MSLADRWTRALDDLQRQGRYRSLRTPAGIDFTSNDYLGYATRRAAGADPPRHGDLPTSGTASRLLSGHHAVWDEVESMLAGWHGTEAALIMTSGYTANEGLLSTVIEPHDWVASDELNHASIIDGLRLSRATKHIHRHNDLDHLEDGLRDAARDRAPHRQLFIVTESLFGMEGDCAPLADLADLADRHGAYLIVDEAHATGCFGPDGSGLVDAAGVRDRVLATVHTGGKALGLTGAYVCGSRRLKEVLVNRCRHLIFTTALPPVVGGWWLRTIPRVQADAAGREVLHQNARRFRTALADHGIRPPGGDYIVPVILGSDATAVAAADLLQRAGYDIRPIRPPTVPVGTARLRVSIHADHDPRTLTAVAEAIAASRPSRS